MGNDSFTPYSTNPNSFVVQNISFAPQKTIVIFQYPINWGQTRNLLAIPGVGPDDIRSSLLKGELRNKIMAGEIVITASDIDLLQFNTVELEFLQNAGIINGLQITSAQLAVIERQDIQLVGAVDGINTIYTIPSGKWIQSSPYRIIVYLNGVKQFYTDDYMIAESGGVGTGFDTVIFTVPPESSIPPIDVVTADYWQNN